MHRTDDQDDGEIFRLLESVDIDPPGLTAEAVAAIARSRRRRSSHYRWAAGILLIGVLGSVAYAMPGSPLRSWLEALRSSQTVPTPAEPIPPPAAPAGIAIDPGEGVAIIFERPSAGSRASITLTDEPKLFVETTAGGARFTAGADRILVFISRDSTLVQVRIPRSAPRVEIYLEKRQLLRKIGSELVAPAPAESDSSYSLDLAP
jgi:hypothetical protein